MNAPKKKGTAAESAVVAYLKANGFPSVERRALRGNKDRGDVAGIPGLVIEVKNKQRTDLAEWVDEAINESEPYEIAVVWHKRRFFGSPGAWYVTMGGQEFVNLLRKAVTDGPGGRGIHER